VVLIPFYCCGGVLVAVLIRSKAIEPVGPTPLPSVTQSIAPTQLAEGQQTATAITVALSATAPVVLIPTPTQLVLNSSPYDPSNANITPIGVAVNATDMIGLPTPIGMIPSCADFNGATNQSIRAVVPPGAATSAHIYCRVITNKYEIGVASVLARGVQVAVDVFALNGGSSVTRFNNPVYVCLQGGGVFIFLDANQSPRTPTQLTSVSDNGYQCANVPNAGTVVLVNQ